MKKKLRHRNVRLQGLALLLSVVLLFVFLPVSAVAEVIGSLTATEEVPVEEVYEVTALREAGVKHFYVGEGKYTAVSYGEAVHRQDATGTWQEIDNTLTLQNGKYQTGDGRVQLAATNGSDNLLQLSENGYSIGLSFATGGADNTAPYALQSVNTTAATVQNVTREAVLEGDSPAVQYEKLSRVLNRSSLQYANLMTNTDVRYTLHGNDVTGRITLRGARESYNVALRLQLTGLSPSLDEAGNVILSDAATGTAVYTIPAPGISAPGLVAAYQLLPVSDGLYLLGITTTPVLDDNISTENFGSLTPGGENTAVMLSVDVISGPGTLTTSAYACGYIDMDNEHSNYTTEGYMYMRGDNVGYLCTDLPGIPQYTTLSSAELDMWYSPYSEEWGNAVDWTDTTLYTMRLYKAAVNWFEMDDWTFYIADVEYEQFGLDMSAPVDTVSVERNDQGYVTFEVTSAVAACYNGSPNYGFGVINGTPGSTFFLNEDHSSVLEITYRYTTVDVPDGIYYIKNVMYSSFLNANAFATGNAKHPTAGSFENDTMHQWQITDLNNGYFEIESVQRPGYVLAAGATVGSTPVVEPRANNDYDQQWYFSNGYYGVTIASRSSYAGTNLFTHCLGIVPGTFLPSRGVQMYSNTDSSNQNEMWLLLNATTALNGQTIEDGIYSINNVVNNSPGRYMLARENEDTAESTSVSGNLPIRSQWRIKYLYNGYYNIISAVDGRVLSVRDTKENTSFSSLALQNDIGSARQQWKITMIRPADTNNEIPAQYKITPRSGEAYETDWCMSAGVSGNGATVMQGAYSVVDCLWSFSEPAYILNLNVFYDNSYNNKVSNASERILTQLQETRAYYYQEFGIYINYSMPQLFTSTADECSETCTCVCHRYNGCNAYTYYGNGEFSMPENMYGHKNYETVACKLGETLYNQGKESDPTWHYFSEAATIVFSGCGDLCTGDFEGEHSDSRKGVTISFEDPYHERNIATCVIKYDPNMLNETNVTLHEIGHLYDTPDHVDISGGTPAEQMLEKYSDYTFDDHCTYGDYWEELTEFSMCAGCQDVIEDRLDVHQHTLLEVAQ